MSKTNKIVITELLSRFVNEVINKNELQKKLLAGDKLRVKLGIDPTSPNIHLGRAVLLLKLRDFQELGHQIVLIIGDATGVIGDTSDKETERPMLAREEVEENAKTYLSQAGKLLDMDKVETHRNSEWLDKLSYKEIGEQANQFSVADFIARDNIKRRLAGGNRVSLREMLYPLMQGYDSVAVKADVELGATDQRFNLLAGRTLQSYYKQEPQNILMTNLIQGLDGRKMSSSWGNTINITDEPSDMYGKVMSVSDDLVESYFIAATRVALDEIKEDGKPHPKERKMKLAQAIVALYHGEKEAKNAEQSFVDTFQKRETPADITEIEARAGEALADTLAEAGVVSSKSEFRRLVEAGAVENTETKEKVTNPAIKVSNVTLKVGKRRFVKITVG